MTMIQWYPGHMAKTRRQFEKMRKEIDVILWIVDARAPFSSMDPTFLSLIQEKPFLMVLNKIDRVSPTHLKKAIDRFHQEEKPAIGINAKNGKNVAAMITKAESLRSKRRLLKELRLAVIGTPNVGKSTLINTLAQRKAQAVANTPGITRNLVWIKASNTLTLLDAPGLMWPKIEDPTVAFRLAAIGSIKDTLLPVDKVTQYIVSILAKQNQTMLFKWVDASIDVPFETLVEKIAQKHGYLTSSGVDTQKVYEWILKAFREGTLGPVYLDD
jgi:ribosome biogenesis GTPase A